MRPHLWDSLGVKAIASMVKARDADPSNLEVLLALGVSHTNGMSLHPFLCCLHLLALLAINGHFLPARWWQGPGTQKALQTAYLFHGVLCL
jgi:hypothetical protein